MADTKLSGLAALTAAGVAPATDLLYIDDVSVTTSKSITVNALGQSMNVLATQQASTSGTEIDFTGIPAGVKRVTIMLRGVSSNGTSGLLIQIGDAGGPEISGYLGAGTAIESTAAATVNFTTGFGIPWNSASAALNGSLTLNLVDAATFSWTCSGVTARSDATSTYLTAGGKSLTAELTQVRITNLNGTDAFDAGAINISYT